MRRPHTIQHRQAASPLPRRPPPNPVFVKDIQWRLSSRKVPLPPTWRKTERAGKRHLSLIFHLGDFSFKWEIRSRVRGTLPQQRRLTEEVNWTADGTAGSKNSCGSGRRRVKCASCLGPAGCKQDVHWWWGEGVRWNDLQWVRFHLKITVKWNGGHDIMTTKIYF